MTDTRKNLETLLAYMKSSSPPPRFDMRQWLADVKGDLIALHVIEDNLGVYNECGTSACLAGHGPLAGIPRLGDENWDDYVTRAFTGGNLKIEIWLFTGYWSDFDNTREGAIDRLETFLTSGVPPTFTAPYDWRP